MSFHIDDEKLLSIRLSGVRLKIKKKIELNALLVYDDGHIKAKIRTYGDKVYAKQRGLNVPEDDIECESFTVISIFSLHVHENKYYLQVYLDNCAYKIANKQMTDYLDENLFVDQILHMLYYDRNDKSQGLDLVKCNKSKECMICH